MHTSRFHEGLFSAHRSPRWDRRLSAALLAAVFPLLLSACDQGAAEPPVADEPMIDALPASTRGLLLIDNEREGSTELPAFEDLTGDLALRSAGVLDVIDLYGEGADLVGGTQKLVLAQTTDASEGFILVGSIEAEDFDALFAASTFADRGEYLGHALSAFEGNGLVLSRLRPELFVIAPEATVRAVIDVREGAARDIRGGPLSPYLDALGGGEPASWVYGLPALYGQVPTLGEGSSSLRRAQVTSGSMSASSGQLGGQIDLFIAGATVLAERIGTLMNGLSFPLVDAPSDDRLSVDLTGLSATDARELLGVLKQLYLGMDGVDYAEAVGHGANPAWLKFNVGEAPNSIFINFEFQDQGQIDAFEAAELPPGFTLAPIRILETDTPRYFLVLNVYQSSGGLVDGARAEWSVFVEDPATGEPRFLVVQAAAESLSADSVNLITAPEPVSHTLEVDAIASYVGVADPMGGPDVLYFSSSIDWPQMPEQRARLHREFTAANDDIYWGNAVADRGLYNASVHNREVVLVDPAQITVSDLSHWAQYVDPTPVHSVVYLNPLEIVVSPWANLDVGYLDVAPDYWQQLVQFKDNFYPAMALGLAEGAVQGLEDPVLPTTRAGSEPSSYYHFSITDSAGLASLIGLDDGHQLASIALVDQDAPGDYLTLALHASDDDLCGMRAEWWVYARDEQMELYSLRLQELTADACLDPVHGLGLPALVSQALDSQQLESVVASPFVAFDASVATEMGQSMLPALDWIEAGDRICATNGVCDGFFYDRATLMAPLSRVDAAYVTLNELRTPWDAFIDPTPASVMLRTSARTLVADAWNTL